MLSSPSGDFAKAAGILEEGCTPGLWQSGLAATAVSAGPFQAEIL